MGMRTFIVLVGISAVLVAAHAAMAGPGTSSAAVIVRSSSYGRILFGVSGSVSAGLNADAFVNER